MSSHPPRRTIGARTGGRSAFVVERVLDAAAEELGRVGFAGLRIEDVAARSGVNKTTIYRRWPSKAELLAAVLDREAKPISLPDTGSLVSDLRAALHDLRARLYTARERGIVRMMLAERAHPDVVAIIDKMRVQHRAARRVLFERAIARGELPGVVDTSLLLEFATAPVILRIMHLGLEVDDAFIDALCRFTASGAPACTRAHATPESAQLEAEPPPAADDADEHEHRAATDSPPHAPHT